MCTFKTNECRRFVLIFIQFIDIRIYRLQMFESFVGFWNGIANQRWIMRKNDRGFFYPYWYSFQTGISCHFTPKTSSLFRSEEKPNISITLNAHTIYLYRIEHWLISSFYGIADAGALSLREGRRRSTKQSRTFL